MRTIIILTIAIVLSSCGLHNPQMQYLGNAYQHPNQNIDVHLAEWFDINNHPDLVPMGKFFVFGNWNNMQRLQKKMKKKAQKMGADVLVIDVPIWHNTNTTNIQYNQQPHVLKLNQHYEARVYQRKSPTTKPSMASQYLP